jgi:cytochrome b involved in lipid metabolism
MLDVFTTYPGPHPLEARRLDASELVLRNDEELGRWLAVEGRVYDVGRFMHVHPGGEKIVRAYSGMDSTRAYRAVLHHVDSEVDAMRGMYEIGVLRRLDFGSEWGVAVGSDGLRYVSLADLYRAWMRFVYSVVEMQNALELDYDIHGRPLTRTDSPEEASAFRVRMLLESHRRFRASYLAFSIGDALHELWALTSGLCARSVSVQELRDRVAEIERSADILSIAATDEHSLQTLHEADGGTLGALAARARALEAEDKRYMRELKSIVRDGVLLFEAHERGTIREAGDGLLACLRSVPELVGDYYGRLSDL